MNVRECIRMAMSLPPHLLIRKVTNQVRMRSLVHRSRKLDSKHTTYGQCDPVSKDKLLNYFSSVPTDLLFFHAEEIGTLANHYLSHRFNLLGSGWVQLNHGMSCSGLEGYRYEMGSTVQVDHEGHWLTNRINEANLKESQRIWCLVDQGYNPIDWQLDFKSGYRWSEDTWYLDIHHGHEPGVDIKAPWELARMQHLPMLAWACALARGEHRGFALPDIYSREFRNQILDFIATNPPRFGVNWRSPMDVGIRVTNWLVAYDLFRAYGAEFDVAFEEEFFRSIYQHGLHVVGHLEWNGRNRGNHYLSNIASLLFVAAYLPSTTETDSWLAFAVQELVNEVEHQFTPDGANFEASTSYHRLSTEMVVYTTALVLGLPQEKKAALKDYDYCLFEGFPKLRPAPIPFYPLSGRKDFTPFAKWYIERLEKMAEFTMDVTKPNGHIAQIGDNDSGRFLKLQPVLKCNGYHSTIEEDLLDHRHLVAAVNGLFDREDFTVFAGQEAFETEVVRSLASNIRLPSDSSKAKKAKENNEMRVYAYPEPGLYIYRSRDMYLAIRCGAIGQNGNGGHAHNDNLSFELTIKGRDFIIDGGSYLYTPFPKTRNDFRSTHAHNTLAVNGYEQNRWKDGVEGLFSMMDDAQAHLIELGPGGFKGEHRGLGKKHYRQFKLQGRFLFIEDVFDATLPGEIDLNLAPGVEIEQLKASGLGDFLLELKNNDVRLGIDLKGFSRIETADGFYSVGYGKRLRNQRIRCLRSKETSLIKITTGLEESHNGL